MSKKIEDKGKDTDDDLEEEESEDSASDEEAADESDDEASDEGDEASDEGDDEASDDGDEASDEGDDEASDDDDEASDEGDDEASDDDAAEGEDAEDEDEDEEVVAASARHLHEERPKRHAAHDHEEEVHEAEPAEDDDPQWWIPHVVMITLILIGVFGFFGVFNKPGRALLEKLNMLPPTLTEAAAPAETAKPAATAKPAVTIPARPMQPGQNEFGAKHLLVMYKGGGRAPPTITRTKEEAKTRAEEALKKAKAGGNFDELVKEYSDEPGAAQRGGVLNWDRGRMVQPFQDAIDKMKANEISDLVETQFGYHVILRTK